MPRPAKASACVHDLRHGPFVWSQLSDWILRWEETDRDHRTVLDEWNTDLARELATLSPGSHWCPRESTIRSPADLDGGAVEVILRRAVARCAGITIPVDGPRAANLQTTRTDR